MKLVRYVLELAFFALAVAIGSTHGGETQLLRVDAVPAGERARLGLDAVYTQYARAAGGIPVVASQRVQPAAVAEAAWLISRMLSHRPDVARAIGRSPVRFVVMAYDEFTTDVPEHSDLTPKGYWNRR